MALLIALCFSSTAASADEPPPRMNVLLLMVDDLNTWVLDDPSRYTGKVVAPNIQRLADEGVLFHNAYAASPQCVPSRTAIFSGVAPWKSGVSRNGVKVDDSKLLQGLPSMFGVFKDHDYTIAKIGKINHGYNPSIDYDFEMKHKRTPPPPGAPLNGIAKSKSGKPTERDWGPTHLDEAEMSDTRLADAAVGQINRDHDKPFFIACGLFHPHYPWYVPQKYLDLYPLDEIVLPPIKQNDFSDVAPIAHTVYSTGWDAKVRENKLEKEAVRGYLASVSYADAQLGRVLNALDNSPHRDNTIVVMMSDHGFHLGSKQQWSKSTLWEEATDSVLMFRVPGVTRPKQVCQQPVSLLDLYPTMMDLAKLPKPDHLDGDSLLPQLKDVASPRQAPPIMVYDGHMAVRTERYRLIQYWDGSTELYDRDKDPSEWVNRADHPDYQAAKAELSAYLPAKDEIIAPLPSRQAGATSNPKKGK
ncbi:MAG: sulfatase [Planctomycetota bacterium]